MDKIEEIKIKIFDDLRKKLEPYWNKSDELDEKYSESYKGVLECNKKGIYCCSCDNIYSCPKYILHEKNKWQLDKYDSKISSITKIYFINRIKRTIET